MRTLIEENRHEQGFSDKQPLAGPHQGADKTGLLLRAIAEDGFHVDAVVHVHHPARLGNGRFTWIQFDFDKLHVITKYLVVHFMHSRHAYPPGFECGTSYYDLRVTLDVVIVGAGAAGLMCAIEAGKRGGEEWRPLSKRCRRAPPDSGGRLSASIAAMRADAVIVGPCLSAPFHK